MLRTISRVIVVLLLLGAVVLIGAWIYFNEERIELNAQLRAQWNESFIEIPNGVVHYELAGPDDGEVIVLVHGFSVPAYIWDPTFEFLAAAGYRVLRFDLFGRGHSDRPDADYTISFFAEQLDQLTRALDLDGPFNLMGLSMGGPVTTWFSNRHPEKVRRLILVDPMVFAPGRDDISPLHLAGIGAYLANVYFIPQLAAGQTADIHDADRFPDWESRFREQMQYRGFRRALLSTVTEMLKLDSVGEYQKLGESGMPVHLFWGREDHTVPFEFSEKLLELLPQARLDVIENAGHIPHFELPEIFNPLLLDHLQKPLNP
jgi:pimeloyl-ACP methyl ester carboxylesterase